MTSLKISYEEMRQRDLKLSEILFMALEILKERFGAFLLLSFLVTLPASAVIQLQAMRVTETEDVELLLQQLAPVAVWALGLSFFLIIGTLVAAVLTKNAILKEPRISFSAAFYQGISKWPHGASALLVLMLRLVCCVMAMGMIIALLPISLLLIFPLFVGVFLYYIMMQECVGITAALRYRALGGNMMYTRIVFRKNFKKNILFFAGIYLIGTLPSQVIGFVVSSFLTQIPNMWMIFGVTVVMDSLLGIFTLFVSIGTTVLYMNQEAVAIREAEERENLLNNL